MVLSTGKFHMLSHQKSHKCFNTLVVVTDEGLVKIVALFFRVRVSCKTKENFK